jgi:hypothetical protein
MHCLKKSFRLSPEKHKKPMEMILPMTLNEDHQHNDILITEILSVLIDICRKYEVSIQ